MKRFLSMVIAVAMLLGTMGITTFAEDGAAVAQVGDTMYESVAEALKAAAESGAAEVKILESTRELLTDDLFITIKADMTITADSPVIVDFYNNGTTYDLVLNGTSGEDLTIAENVTLTVSDRNIWVGHSGNNIDIFVDGGLIGGYQLWFGGDITVSSTGTVVSKGEALVARRNAKLTVNGGTLTANYFSLLSGTVELNNATATTGPLWLSSNAEGAGHIVLNNSTLTTTGNMKLSGGASVTVTSGSELDITDVHGYGDTVIGENCTLTIDTSSSVANTKAITGTGEIMIDATDFNGTSASVLDTAGMSGFTGNVSVVNNSGADYEVSEDGTITIIEKVDESVLKISTIEELKAFADAVNAGDSFVGKTVLLMNDINMMDEEEIVAEYTPIGTAANSFKGTFDGQGHKIENVYCTIYDEEDLYAFAGSCVGLFGCINTPAVVKNVTVTNPFLVAERYVGGIVGMAYTGEIDNCHVIGEIDIEGNYMVGGITGHGYAKITNCSVIGEEGWDYNYIGGIYKAADLEGDNVGGIVGHKAENTTISGCTVKNVTVEGTRKIGGIVGTSFQNNIITGCTVENVILSTNATEDYAAANASSMGLGGIIGITAQNYTGGTVSDCSVSGVTFETENELTTDVSMGAITGGHRANGKLNEPTETVFENNTVDTATVTGANNTYLMPATAVAKIGDVEYTSLEAALKALTADATLELFDDVTITTDWDNRYTGARITVPVTINGNGHTLKFTGTVSDAGNHFSVFRFQADATVNNLTIDVSEATGANNRIRAISSNSNLTVDNCKFIGNPAITNARAIIYGESSGANIGNVVVSVTNSEFVDWKRGVGDNENAQDAKSVTVTGNIFTNAGAALSATDTITFTGNTVTDAYVSIKSYTESEALTVVATGNTLTANDMENNKMNQIDVATNNVTAQEDFYIVKPEVSAEICNTIENVWTVTDKDEREAFVVQLKNVTAYESLKVETYSGDKLLATTTLRETHRDDNTALYPIVEAEWFTVNVVVGGNDLSGSWDTVVNATLYESDIPDNWKVYCDGTLIAEAERTMSEEWIAAYKGLDAVKEAPALPTATVTETGTNVTVSAVDGLKGTVVSEIPLTFTMNFKADPITDEQLAYYKDWEADFVLKVNVDVTGNDGYLAGQYDWWSNNWVKVADPGTEVILPANVPMKVMGSLADGAVVTYGDVYNTVNDFDCGIYLTPEFIAAHPELELTLSLQMTNPEKPEEVYTIGDVYEYTAEDATVDPDAATKAALSVVLGRSEMGVQANGTYKAGFYAGLDSLNYKKAGIRVYDPADYNAEKGAFDKCIVNWTTTTGYTALTDSKGTITAGEYGVSRLFGFVLTNIPSSYANKFLVYEPYVVTFDDKEITTGKYWSVEVN